MAKNIDSVVDNDVFELISEERKKKGVLKSKIINEMLREKYSRELGSDDEIKNGKDNKEKENEIKDEKKDSKVEWGFDIDKKKDNPKDGIKDKPNISTESTANLKPSDTKPLIDSIKDNTKLAEVKKIIQPAIQTQNAQKKEIRRDKMAGELETTPRKSAQEVFKELRDKEEFDKKMKDIHTKIHSIDDRVCKDGECLQNLKKEFENSVKNSTEKLSDLKTRIEKLNELDSMKKDLSDIRERLKENEVCPNCSEKVVPHLSSYCPNCAQKFTEWTDEKGNKVLNWRPYSERYKK